MCRQDSESHVGSVQGSPPWSTLKKIPMKHSIEIIAKTPGSKSNRFFLITATITEVAVTTPSKNPRAPTISNREEAASGEAPHQ